jgi:polysaccharide pyruvyl transferase WcaK-like protein
MSAVRPALFATAEAARAVEAARAAVVLVGSYDGSGNYGDIAQFEAALALAGRLEPGVLALPLLERQYLGSHRRLTEEAGVAAPNALFFDPEGLPEDGLLAVPAPADLAFAGAYLYGGGYLNRLWGPRKLAMLEAAEALLEAGGAAVSCRLASGLQVEPGWLAAGQGPALRRFELLGARDAESRQALAGLGVEAAVSGDDAIGLLDRPPAGPAAGNGAIRLNLHFAEHGWMSEDPGAVLDFQLGLATELGRLAGRPVLAQPLIAYLDDRVDERGGVERLRRACVERGVEVEPPLLLRPAELGALGTRLAAADLTVSCSYHVALTSLMLGVPALLLGENAYYEQKAAGLRRDFDLPPALAAATGADPAAKAGEVAAVLEGERGAALRAGLAVAAERQRRRRARTEVELLGRLGAAAAAALGTRVGEQVERLRDTAAEPAELRARLSAAAGESESLRRRLEESPLEAELRVREARADTAAAEAELAAILHSRSWRLLSPLRRLRALLRRG